MSKSPLENFVHHIFQAVSRAELEPLSDRQLLQRYVEQRDQYAFGTLVHRHEDMVWGVCWRELRHRQDVEDAFQATFLALLRGAASMRWQESIEGWLHTLASRIAKKGKLARTRRRIHEDRSRTMPKGNAEEDSAHRECIQALDEEIARLPEKYRSPLILCYLEGLTQEQAAQRMNIPLRTLERHLAEGRERLGKRLSRRGMDVEKMILMADVGHGAAYPAISPGLVEKTLDMARILMQSNGVLQTEGISAGVAMLAKSTMGVWSVKVKVLLGFLLTTLAVVGGGMATYSGWLYMSGEPRSEKRTDQDNKTPEKPKTTEKLPPHADCYGDPLPKGALRRLGTVRFRPGLWGDNPKVIAFTPDGKSLLTAGKFPCLWDMSTGKLMCQFGDSLQEKWGFGETALSPDGKFVASRPIFSKDRIKPNNGDIYLWETKTGKLIRQWESCHRLRVPNSMCCAFSPDSQALVTSFNNENHPSKVSLGLWDIATGQRRWEQKLWWEEKNQRERKEICCRHCVALAISPDGTILADGGKSDRLQRQDARWSGVVLRDAHTGQSLRVLGPPRSIKSLCFSPDGHTLLVLYEQCMGIGPSVYSWDIATGKENWHLDNQRGGYAEHIAFSPDGTLVAISHSLREASTGRELRCCQQDDAFNWFGSPVFSPDGKILASIRRTYGLYGTRGPIIRCWEVASGKMLAPRQPLPGHETAIDSVAFMEDGTTLVSGGCNDSTYIWDTLTGRQRFTLCPESRIQSWLGFSPVTRNPLTVTALSPNGKLIAGRRLEIPDRKFDWNTLRASIVLWDAQTKRELRHLELTLRQSDEIPIQIIFSPNSQLLAVCLITPASHMHKGRVFLYDVVSGKLNRILAGVSPTFSPDGTRLLTFQEEVLNLWDIRTGENIASVLLETDRGYFSRLAISPDWKTLALGTGQALKLYSLHEDKLSTLRLGPPRLVSWSTPRIGILVFSPDGRTLAAAGEDLTVYVWEAATGLEWARFTGHGGRIRSLSFSPDGRRLASGSEDTTILVWDLTGRLDDWMQLRPARLSAKSIDEAWGLLAVSDAVQARRAIWNLVAAGSQTVSFLKEHLHPATEQHGTADLYQLIVDLDSDIYAVRQQARQRLEALGDSVEPNLRQVLEKQASSLEMRRTLQLLLTTIEAKRTFLSSGEELRQLRAIEVLEHLGTDEARQWLTVLSHGTSDARLTHEAQAALSRLNLKPARKAPID